MLRTRQDRQAWALLLPLLLIMLAVTGYPLASTVRLSFTDAILTGRASMFHWVGWDDFRYVFTDPDFGDAFWRTLYFAIVSVGIEIVLGVLVALLLDCEFYGRAFMRALIVLPWALPTIVNAMLWRLIYNPEFGSLNALLSQFGLIDSYRSWLGDTDSAMNMVIVADVWKNYPLVALIVLAALQTIPRDLYQAAAIDGAGPWTRFWKITFPHILGPLSVALILRMIEAFKVFDIIYVMTRGGPADSTKTVSFFVYQESFSYLRAGSGAAYALVVTLASAVMIATYITLLRRREGVMNRRPGLLVQILTYAAVIVLAVATLAPLLWLFIMSISSTKDLTSLPLHWIPDQADFSRYARLLTLATHSAGEEFVYALRNSLGAAIGASAIALLAGIPAAYSFSRFPGRMGLLYTVLATYMMPPVALILPLYMVFSALGLLNSVAALVIVYCTILLPFVTWLLKANFDTVPLEIEQAARIDGASLFGVIRHVTLPIAKAGLGTTALFAVLLAWDEFFYALLYTNDLRAKTLPVAIADFAAGRATDYALISAAGILTALPPLLIAFFLQKSLISGLAAGGVKG